MKNLRTMTISAAIANFVLAILILLYGLKTYGDFISRQKPGMTETQLNNVWFKVVADSTNAKFLQLILVVLVLLLITEVMAIIMYRSYKQPVWSLIIGILAIILFFAVGASFVSFVFFISSMMMFYQLYKWSKSGIYKTN
ncbi:MAG: hypothetical protein LBM27_02160 [Lactobacillaceae bacterium]|jgi:hypothetical protein|nr:hypothetical protein [Lactobacillaceae bacterium]